MQELNGLNISEAKNEVDDIASALSDVVAEMSSRITSDLDKQVTRLKVGINLLSNSELWDIMMCLSVEAYRVGIAKEQSSLQDACATALYKEGIAKSYSLTPGAVEAKKQQAVLDTIDKQAVSILYATVTNLLKTKCDEAHRLVSVINGVLISRAAEAKLKSSPRSEVEDVNPFNLDQGE